MSADPIAVHYRDLVRAARVAAALADMTEAYVPDDFAGRYHVLNAVRRIANRATALAVHDWPTRRAEIAEEDGTMPIGPVEYTVEDGVVLSRIGGISITCPRIDTIDREHHAAIIAQAWEEERRELRAAADRAAAAKERYRRAIAQGVALPPTSPDAEAPCGDR